MQDGERDDLAQRPLRQGMEDLEIKRSSSPEPPAPAGGDTDGPPVLMLVVVAIVVLLLLGGGFWWFRSRGADAPPAIGAPEVTQSALSTPSSDSADPAPVDVVADLPELDASDAWLRTLVATVSSHPSLARWLLNEDLVRRGVKVIANVAYEEDPRVHVDFMAPEGDFAATSAEGGPISARSMQRYDLLADAFTSVDAEGASRLYVSVSPLAEQAYDELGYPGSFAESLEVAIDKLLAVPDLEYPPSVMRQTLSYHYQDPQLEALDPAQKLLLRMGPRNVRRIQQQLRSLERALPLS